MNGAGLKEKIRAGGIVYGCMISTGRNPRWVLRLTELGVDYVVIDTEHSPFSRGEVADLMTTLNYAGIAPIVRTPIPTPHHATMALDAGAQGVLAPYCETVEEVREVVGAVKWRPLKGQLLSKAMSTGEFPSGATKEYLERRNRNSVCIIGIESVPAIENLGRILGVAGVDAIFVGPNDLSISLGVPDQYDHPEYESALRHVLKLCSVHNVPTLMHHQTPELTSKWLREGAKFVLYSSDARLMHRGASQDFAEIRRVGEEMGDAGARAATHSQEVL